MTASPGFTYTNDILGNRTAKTPTGGSGGGNTWDCLNLLAQINPSACSGGIMPVGGQVSFTYRADGMRVQKIDHSGQYQIGGGEINDQYAWYRYDGQMTMETAITKADGPHEVIDDGLGARGVDYVQVTKIPTSGSSTVTVAYPLYDAHGNEVATISRSGSSYALANQRSYGAWGEIRQGAVNGGPRGHYCGNLGHVQDDETGLIYMRARYYEASSGRFISEDRAMEGLNWFAYGTDNPIRNKDASGKNSIYDDGSGIWVWFNTVGQDSGFGKLLQGIVQEFQSGSIDVKDAAEKMGEIWHNIPANFYPGVVAGVNGSWKLCVKIPQLMVDILAGDFDYGAGISGDIEQVVESAIDMTFEFTISGAE